MIASDLVAELAPDRAPFASLRVALAFSAGGDSVALALLLQAAGWSPERILLVHVDHRKRPESNQDAEFAQAFGARHGLAVVIQPLAATVTQHASAAALRDLRYACLRRVAAQAEGALVVAHTLDDQRETRLLALLRGSGLHGLSGLRTWQNGIWRPLLTVSREQLRDYLTARGETWCDDRTNLDFSSLRARLRHVVLPAVGRPLGDVEALRTQMLQDEDDFLDGLASAALAACGDETLMLQPFAELVPPIQRRVLRRWLQDPAIVAERIEALRLGLLAPPPSRPRTFEMGQKLAVCVGAKSAKKIPP